MWSSRPAVSGSFGMNPVSSAEGSTAARLGVRLIETESGFPDDPGPGRRPPWARWERVPSG
jgi:hypothetical protein